MPSFLSKSVITTQEKQMGGMFPSEFLDIPCLVRAPAACREWLLLFCKFMSVPTVLCCMWYQCRQDTGTRYTSSTAADGENAHIRWSLSPVGLIKIRSNTSQCNDMIPYCS